MTNALMKVLDQTFAHPSGRLGELGGKLMARMNAPVEEQVVSLAKPAANETVLVIGPGPGVGLRAAGTRAALAIGVDPSETMLTEARHRCADLIADGRVQLRHGTAAATGQDTASVDVVISVNNVRFWEDRRAAFAELARVLRPNGRLVVSITRWMLPITDHELVQEALAAGFSDVNVALQRFPGPAPAVLQLTARVSP
ncbi:methyltransferase [Lentzea sp. NBRC 105346]|uniref:class I SAM-dependent methyltransferase n=1 Tax=Lentzea sp. NBRC 105346 TaxID=3032205 RepID=UPI00255384AE|nr:methyltransferase domain-containing protein [Lentzea sp. NBRC 105346]GLZ34031.1 methyltransferase [Lentzea sp. NBRC 105346]